MFPFGCPVIAFIAPHDQLQAFALALDKAGCDCHSPIEKDSWGIVVYPAENDYGYYDKPTHMPTLSADAYPKTLAEALKVAGIPSNIVVPPTVP